MKKICYVANMSSPHVRQWLDLLDSDMDLSVATIDTEVDLAALSNYGFRVSNVVCLPKSLRFFPKVLKYVALGLMLRFRRDGRLLHAHNTSGYGLAALLSGKKFIVTTYGTEIYRAPSSSIYYRSLIRAVLKKAVAITASTDYMKRFLSDFCPGIGSKTYAFSLGVRDEFISTPTVSEGLKKFDRPVWFSNRRVLPLYRTIEILRAFKKFKRNGGSGSLVILQGDAKGEYVDLVRAEACGCDAVRFVEGFVDTETLINLLDASDFIVSVPKTDQLSSSILEGMARGCIPILSDLDAYAVVLKKSICIDDGFGVERSLENAFKFTQSMSSQDYESRSKDCREYVKSEFGKESAIFCYRDVVENVCGLM